MQVEYSAQPDKITYMALPNGTQADVWLRKDITEVTEEMEDGTTNTKWTAEEVYCRTSLTEVEIEESFDEIFENGFLTETEEETSESGITNSERLDVLEDATLEIADMLAEVMAMLDSTDATTEEVNTDD